MHAASHSPRSRARLAAIWAASSLLLAGCQFQGTKGWQWADGSVAAGPELELAQTYCKGELQKAYIGIRDTASRWMDENEVFAGCMAGRGLMLKKIM